MRRILQHVAGILVMMVGFIFSVIMIYRHPESEMILTIIAICFELVAFWLVSNLMRLKHKHE